MCKKDLEHPWQAIWPQPTSPEEPRKEEVPQASSQQECVPQVEEGPPPNAGELEKGATVEIRRQELQGSGLSSTMSAESKT